MATAELLQAEGCAVRVVSMPCPQVFDRQDAAYREAVLPARIRHRLAIEAGVSEGWYRYVGDNGRVLGIDRFGESAPAEKIFELLGFTPVHAADLVRSMLGVKAGAETSN